MSTKEQPGWFWNGDKLRQWRQARNISVARAAQIIGVSCATYYRYEADYVPPIESANSIVRMTRGAIRYRDMFPFFEVKYA